MRRASLTPSGLGTTSEMDPYGMQPIHHVPVTGFPREGSPIVLLREPRLSSASTISSTLFQS